MGRILLLGLAVFLIAYPVAAAPACIPLDACSAVTSLFSNLWVFEDAPVLSPELVTFALAHPFPEPGPAVDPGDIDLEALAYFFPETSIEEFAGLEPKAGNYLRIVSRRMR